MASLISQNAVTDVEELWMNKGFATGKVEQLASQRSAFLHGWKNFILVQFKHPLGGRAKHAVAALQIAPIGHMEPALFESS